MQISIATQRPIAVGPGHEALADDAAQGAGEREAYLLLLVRREEVDDAVDGLLRVGRVQRRHDEVAGLGRGERRLDGLGVTHLADEDDVGVLPHRGAQRVGEVVGVDADLALVDHAELVVVEDLDGVLDRHDVDLAVVVDVVDHAGQRRGLAGAGRAGDQDQAAGLHRERGEHRRHAEVVERDGADADAAEDQTGRATGAERVDAEPSDARDRVREVGLVGLLELLDEVLTQHLGDERLGVRGGEDRGLQLAQTSVDAYPRR